MTTIRKMIIEPEPTQAQPRKENAVTHSPLPWTSHEGRIWTWRNGRATPIAVTEETPRFMHSVKRETATANAAHIVRACNNAQRLADAVSYALKAYDNGYDDDEVELTMAGIREALTEWEGGAQ